jgi:hypothetical protein
MPTAGALLGDKVMKSHKDELTILFKYSLDNLTSRLSVISVAIRTFGIVNSTTVVGDMTTAKYRCGP